MIRLLWRVTYRPSERFVTLPNSNPKRPTAVLSGRGGRWGAWCVEKAACAIPVVIHACISNSPIMRQRGSRDCTVSDPTDQINGHHAEKS
jgi:hypothetical protein